MNRIKNLFGIFAFALLLFALPTIASAQWGGNNRDRNRDRDDDSYGRNSGYYMDRLKDTIKRLERDSRDFARFVDRDLDRGKWESSRREDNLNRLVNDFKRATERLKDRFDTRNLSRSQNEAQQVINLANQINRSLRRYDLSYDVENYWYNNIQRQVREVENAYRYNNRGRSNNGRWGDWRDIFGF